MKSKIICLGLLFLLLSGCSNNSQAQSGNYELPVVQIEIFGPEFVEKQELYVDNWVSSGGYRYENGNLAFEVSLGSLFGVSKVRYRFGDSHSMGAYHHIDKEAILAVYVNGEPPRYFRLVNNELMTYLDE